MVYVIVGMATRGNMKWKRDNLAELVTWFVRLKKIKF